MKPEKHQLISDLLNDTLEENRRAATLLAGGRLLRHKRWRRAVTQSFAVAAVATLAAISLHRAAPHPHTFSATRPSKPAVDYLTDDQLLALFPNTPVGLATIGDKKVLIFPRLGDQERFVGRF
jgi:hypothetical protein